MVVKSYDETEETVLISGSTTIHQHVYDSEGNLVAVVKINMNYVGTMKAATGQMWTGRGVIDWIVNLLEDVPIPFDLKGHWVIWLEEGNPVREIGFGEPFFL